jgi:hypothetical protein
MIDAEHLETARGLGVGILARRVDGGGERYGLAEFAAVHFAAFEALDQISDESFHAVVLLDIRRMNNRTLAFRRAARKPATTIEAG